MMNHYKKTHVPVSEILLIREKIAEATKGMKIGPAVIVSDTKKIWNDELNRWEAIEACINVYGYFHEDEGSVMKKLGFLELVSSF